MREVLRYLRLSGASFMATVTACVTLQPSDVWTHNGLSFYGNFQRTLLPYAMGLSLTAYFLLRASRSLPEAVIAERVRRPLWYIGLALLGVVLTPSLSGSRPVQFLHVLFGGVVFVLQLVVSWRLARMHGAGADYVLLGTQLAALGVVLLSFREINQLSIMLPAQAVAIAAFGEQLLRALRREALPAEAMVMDS
jgi:hypothetical protein